MKHTIVRTMYYPTFDEEKNEFTYEEIEHERPMNKRELKWYKIATILWAIYWSLFIVGIMLFLIGVCSDLKPLGMSALVAIGTDLLLVIIYHYTIERRYDSIMLDAQGIGFDEEILRWEQITQEQNDIAEQWRKAHPFEEQIRKTMLSQNCVDVAKTMQQYAQILKEIKTIDEREETK